MEKLLRISGSLAYIAIVFLNVAVDFGHKIVMQGVVVRVYSGKTEFLLSLLINILMLLPFIMFFAAFGYINDRISKTTMIKLSSLLSVFLSLGIVFCYFFGMFKLAFLFIFLFSIQSALFSPAKYGIIKTLFGIQNLGYANAIVQLITVVAIGISSLFFSNFFNGILTSAYEGTEILKEFLPIAIILFLMSVLEFMCSYYIPIYKPDSNIRVKHFNFKYSFLNLRNVFMKRSVGLCILSIALFWGVTQAIIVALPVYYSFNFIEEGAYTILHTLMYGILGFAIGAIVAARYSKDHIELGITPFGAIGIFLALIILGASNTMSYYNFSSFIYGFSGAIFVIPLYGAIQFFGDSDKISKTVAVLNFTQAMSMMFFICVASLFIYFSIDVRIIFLVLAMIICTMIIVAIKELPNLFFRILLFPILKMNYKIEVDGAENIPRKGGVLLLGNHISFIDWIIIQIAVPRPVKFVMKSAPNRWYIRLLSEIFRAIDIKSFSDEKEIKNIKNLLNNGEVVAMFPENHITYNGQLGEFHRDFELVAKDTNCMIVPFYIRGLWGSSFSRAIKSFKEINKISLKRVIRISFGKPVKNNSSAVEVKKRVFELSFFSWGKYLDSLKPVQYNWIRQAKLRLFKKALVDSTGADLSNFKMIAAVLIFIKKLKRKIDKQSHIGVILPPSAAGSIINLMLFIRGKVPVNLNYTLNKENLLASVDKVQIKTIITSRKFISRLKMKGFDIEELISDKVVYLEDIGAKIKKSDRIKAALVSLFAPGWLIKSFYFKNVDINDEATVIFSSGSEDSPKGVVLTHKNLLSNVKQVTDIMGSIDINVILSSLPVFHSFGLTVTTLIPLNEGMMSVNVADPTDAYEIGKMSAKYQATVIFGTSTFFRIYNKSKKLNPLMFSSIRVVVSGAEKLKEEVKKEFKIKFGLEILEGYGTTETSPVVSCNMPNALEPEFFEELTFNKAGTVGLPLPGTVIKIVDEESMSELRSNQEGLILIGGNQVMKCYYKDEVKTQSVIELIDGVRYYKSGDIGYLDDDGFLTITDRKLRFAKIGGEMISLTTIEVEIGKVLGDEVDLIAVNVEDNKKGEKVVILYSNDEFSEDEIMQKIRGSKLPPIMLPSKLYKVAQLPLLGSGKVDFKGAKALAKDLESKK